MAKKTANRGGIPLWMTIVIGGVLIVMALTISFLVLLHLDIIRCVPVQKPVAEATPVPSEAIAATPEPQITPEPATPAPTEAPTAEPTAEPTEEPTPEPTEAPTAKTTAKTTAKPASFKFGGKTIKAGTTSINGKKLGINGSSGKYKHITKEEVQNLIELCPDLEELELDYCYMDDYEPIGKLTKLKRLELSRCYHSSKGNAISGIGWIKKLTNLTYLKLRHNRISDVSALTGLKKLTELNLGENRLGNDDMKDLAKITSLKKLYLYHQQDLTDVSPLAKLSGLEFLSLGENSKLENVKPLTGLVYLKQLRLYDTAFDNPSYLKEFAQLEKIDVTRCPISDKAYYQLGDVGTLRHVVLSKKDTDGINALKALIAEGCRIGYSHEW